jgi:osmotically-inducible protein OsmY
MTVRVNAVYFARWRFCWKKQESIMSDLQLREDILNGLEFEPSVNAAHIGVAVESGVVTLTGHVSTYPERPAAVKAVRRVKGVRAIAEEIEVRFLGDRKTTPDDEIAKRAVDVLGWDTMVPSGSIQITVHDGWVTLTGNVDWYYQLKAAEEDVRKLPGVRGVVNNIAITSRVQAQDVKRKNEDALKRHADALVGFLRDGACRAPDRSTVTMADAPTRVWNENQ